MISRGPALNAGERHPLLLFSQHPSQSPVKANPLLKISRHPAVIVANKAAGSCQWPTRCRAIWDVIARFTAVNSL